MSRHRKTGPLTIVLEDLDFGWEESKIRKVIDLLEAGTAITEIARQVRKSPGRSYDDAEYETALLVMHLSRQKCLELRGDKKE